MGAHLLSLASLFAVSLATCLVPGPNNFMLMRLGMRRGRGAALAAGVGTTLSCIVWCAAAALGLAAVLAAAPWLYKALRIGGGLYLLWFAWSLWRSPPLGADERAEAATGRGGYIWQGFAINMTNPKSVLFFASIFSAYVGPDTPLWVHIAAVTLVCITCLAWQVAMAFVFSARAAAGAYGRAQRPLDLAAALLMGAFGISLIWLE
ncbi:LysE family translocator [Phenylobacterium sp.]|uniref:LysE family translocator n=1 Tax=Phenylobacterium sp. TaxID=1871053 RepID=UPI002DF499CF|nr:LysE family translocator [Phenylobacterium sp.]